MGQGRAGCEQRKAAKVEEAHVGSPMEAASPPGRTGRSSASGRSVVRTPGSRRVYFPLNQLGSGPNNGIPVRSRIMIQSLLSRRRWRWRIFFWFSGCAVGTDRALCCRRALRGKRRVDDRRVLSGIVPRAAERRSLG